jgi:hypothetical protein
LRFTVVATEDFTKNLKFNNPFVDIPLVLEKVIRPFTAKLVEHTQAELLYPPDVHVGDPVRLHPEVRLLLYMYLGGAAVGAAVGAVVATSVGATVGAAVAPEGGVVGAGVADDVGDDVEGQITLAGGHFSTPLKEGTDGRLPPADGQV